MKVFKTKIKGRSFRLAVAYKNDDRIKGLSDTESLGKEDGILFVFKEENTVTFNTYKMNYPIDMIFLDEDFIVVDYVVVHPKRDIATSGVKYVIEFNAGTLPSMRGSEIIFSNAQLTEYVKDLSGIDDIKDYDEVDDIDDFNGKKKEEDSAYNIIVTRIAEGKEAFKRGGKVIKPVEDLIKSNPESMQVLDDSGTVLMNIEGGERIFSRIHTKKLLDMVRKVKAGQATHEELGSLMSQIVKVQDGQEAQYVYE